VFLVSKEGEVLNGILGTVYNTATLMEFVRVYANEFENGVRSGRISGNSIREAKQHARRALLGEIQSGFGECVSGWCGRMLSNGLRWATTEQERINTEKLANELLKKSRVSEAEAVFIAEKFKHDPKKLKALAEQEYRMFEEDCKQKGVDPKERVGEYVLRMGSTRSALVGLAVEGLPAVKAHRAREQAREIFRQQEAERARVQSREKELRAYEQRQSDLKAFLRRVQDRRLFGDDAAALGLPGAGQSGLFGMGGSASLFAYQRPSALFGYTVAPMLNRPEFTLTPHKWDTVMKEFVDGNTTFSIGDGFFEVHSKTLGTFKTTESEYRLMRAIEGAGLDHVDLDLIAVASGGKTLLTIGESALAKIAARTTNAEIKTLVAEVMAKKSGWCSWSQAEKVIVNQKEYAKFNDRLYSRHAVDRTLPSSLGAPVGTKGAGRNISPAYVEEVLRHPDRVESVVVDGVNREIYRSGDIAVVTEDKGRVIVTILRGKE
jgi:hypothetical protein